MPVDVKLKAIKMVDCVHDNNNSIDHFYSIVFNWQEWAYWTLQDQQNVYINSSEINIIFLLKHHSDTYVFVHVHVRTHTHDRTGVQKECNEERKNKIKMKSLIVVLFVASHVFDSFECMQRLNVRDVRREKNSLFWRSKRMSIDTLEINTTFFY